MQLIDLQSEFETRESETICATVHTQISPFSARYYDSFSLSFSSCRVDVFNGVYERERAIN